MTWAIKVKVWPVHVNTSVLWVLWFPPQFTNTTAGRTLKMNVIMNQNLNKGVLTWFSWFFGHCCQRAVNTSFKSSYYSQWSRTVLTLLKHLGFTWAFPSTSAQLLLLVYIITILSNILIWDLLHSFFYWFDFVLNIHSKVKSRMQNC